MSDDLFLAKFTADQIESHGETADTDLEHAAQLFEMVERLRAFEGGPYYARYCRRVSNERLNLRMEEALTEIIEDRHFAAVEPEEFFERLVEASGAEPGELDPDNAS